MRLDGLKARVCRCVFGGGGGGGGFPIQRGMARDTNNADSVQDGLKIRRHSPKFSCKNKWGILVKFERQQRAWAGEGAFAVGYLRKWHCLAHNVLPASSRLADVQHPAKVLGLPTTLGGEANHPLLALALQRHRYMEPQS